jgi:alginate O-acetyltransferase complex protein AlgJ
MLLRYRRFFAVVAFVLLATPLLAGVIMGDNGASVVREGRTPARPPTAPRNIASLVALPQKIDMYLRDRFGLRRALIDASRDLTKPLLGFAGGPVVIGRDGRMFYSGDEMLRQSAGLVLRDKKVSEAAELVAQMGDELKRRGVKFIVAVPPNASTVYQDDLPIWAQNRGKQTEYDLFLKNLANYGIEAIDLRPLLMTARSEGNVFYFHDTHWTYRGALAAFNAIVQALGHPNWRLDAASALGAPTIRKGGDLARMLGVQDSTTESVEPLVLPSNTREDLSVGATPDYAILSDSPGPTILVIGDSFTYGYFPPMLTQHVKKAVWLHYQHCAFDWDWIDRLHPDEVWWMPTERGLICEPGATPRNFIVEQAHEPVSDKLWSAFH